MAAEWSRKRVLITIRTYPTPARKGVEVSCTAGITSDSQWIRLHPIPYRSLDEDRQFAKYHWIDADVTKAKGDARPESYTPNLDSIKLGDKVPTTDGWRIRKEIIRPLLRPSLCGIQKERDERGFPTLGIFKPAKIKRLVIEPTEADWSADQLEKLNQTLSLFGTAAASQLEKIPFNFKYEFSCTDTDCDGHSLSCTDWEVGQSYRKWRREYGSDWELAFRQKYEKEMRDKFDTHFFVGNIHQYPNAWIIVGLFYPPLRTTGDLFD